MSIRARWAGMRMERSWNRLTRAPVGSWMRATPSVVEEVERLGLDDPTGRTHPRRDGVDIVGGQVGTVPRTPGSWPSRAVGR